MGHLCPAGEEWENGRYRRAVLKTQKRKRNPFLATVNTGQNNVLLKQLRKSKDKEKSLFFKKSESAHPIKIYVNGTPSLSTCFSHFLLLQYGLFPPLQKRRHHFSSLDCMQCTMVVFSLPCKSRRRSMSIHQCLFVLQGFFLRGKKAKKVKEKVKLLFFVV